jgi:tRNA (guanine6-N2)-methyltransferase
MDVSPVPVSARVVRGIEWIACAEIRTRLAVRDLEVSHREIRFLVPALGRELLELGTVDDAFVVAGTVDGVGRGRGSLERLAAEVHGVDLDRFRELTLSIRARPPERIVDVVASFLGPRNYNRYEVEAAVGTALARSTGWTYVPRAEVRPPPSGLSIRVHIDGDRATLGVRLGMRPLHRRAYRVASRPGALRPPLARALALLAGLRPGACLLDPFCGVGTVAIEAELASPVTRTAAFDLDPAAVAAATRNALEAGASLRVAVADAACLPVAAGSVDRVATNLPWGTRVLGAGRLRHDPGAFAAELGRILAADGRIALLGRAGGLDRAARECFDVLLEHPVRILGALATVAVLGRRAAGQDPIDRSGLYGAALQRELRHHAG